MIHKKLVLQLLVLAGLALVSLVLTLVIPALAQADANIRLAAFSDQQLDVQTESGNLAATDDAIGNAFIVQINFQKTPANQTILSGGTANFTLTLKNTGDTDLNVLPEDPLCDDPGSLADFEGDAGTPGVLDIGETWTINCAVSGMTIDFTNRATVTVAPVLTPALQIQETAQANVDVIHPSLDFQKTPANQTILSGDTANFTLTLKNTGDTNLFIPPAHLPEDPLCDDPGSLTEFTGDTSNPGVLDTGETWTINCTVSGMMIDFTNRATVTVAPVLTPALLIQETAQANVDVIHPGIDVQKTPDTQTVAVDSSANFTITVDNIGDVSLSNINVDDPLCDSLTGPSGDTGNPGVLNTTETWTYNCTVNTVQASFINAITVTGKPPVGPNVSDTDGAQVLLQSVVDICTISGRPDLLAYWKLDESTGSPYEDFYGGQHGETCPGGHCPTSAQGRVKGAQTFDGTSTGIDVFVPGQNAFDWGANDSFSIEVWMKSAPGGCTGSATEDNEVIIGRDDANSNLHWWLGCQASTSHAFFNLRDIDGLTAGEDPAFLESTTPVNDGQWHHLVAVRDGGAATQRLYVDGAEVDSRNITYSAGFGSATAALNIGWLNLSGGFHFAGEIDEVAIYDGVLGADVIAAHYNGGLGKAAPDYCEGLYPPTILSNPPATVTLIDELYSYDVEANGSPAPTYQLNGPTEMSIVSNSGLITWTPTLSQTGNHLVTITATNSEGSDVQEFTLRVATEDTIDLKVYLPLVVKN